MKKGEPPSQSCSQSSPLLVGRDRRGHWVVRSMNGLCGGLFVSRAEALRFALFENGHRRDGVVMVGGLLELNLNEPENGASWNRPMAKRKHSRQNQAASKDVGPGRMLASFA
jgi:hypothetical protein